MKNKNHSLVIIIILPLLCSVGYADYTIDWHTIDSGGGTSCGGSYQLTGAITQLDAGYHSGGAYELLGGFWHTCQFN